MQWKLECAIALIFGKKTYLILKPELFRQLKSGSRIVSHDFDMGDWKPDRTIHLISLEESNLYYWVIP